MSPRIKTIVFDFDDTLVETGVLFHEVLDSLVSTITSALPGTPPPAADILKTQSRFDIELVEQMGVVPERFAQSLIRTYRFYLEKYGLSSEPEREAFLEREGARAFHDLPALSEDTLMVLKTLKDREKILYTWGLPEIQMRRLGRLHLTSYFSEIHCVPAKTTTAMKRVIGTRDPDSVLICGDSLRSEIAPALELGCHAAHLRRPDGWDYHNVPVSGNYHLLSRLGDLLGVIGDLDAKPDSR
ncbi:MAG: HAD family hydrolase [Candidatus Hydrogenedentota bacterium]|nr:MAG: HAD family hydrolase [Candidatus Hydrogenedentota bacterium]